jgi:MoxR-like ATPase
MQTDDDLDAVHRLREAFLQITHELSKVVIGQKQVIEELLVAMFARGHCLLVGVPGLAKTLMIRTVADALTLQFSRIQFTGVRPVVVERAKLGQGKQAGVCDSGLVRTERFDAR